MVTSIDHLMTFKKWQFGDVIVTRVMEMDTLNFPPAGFLQTTAATVLAHGWLQEHFATPEGNLLANIQAFIIEAGGKRIMVDPCVGNHKPRDLPMFTMLDNPFLERLNHAGFPRESIDYVMCTHLHFDHCGWNTMLVDGEWVPTFPNARYLFYKTELDYAETGKTDKDADHEATYADSVKPILNAGLADLIDHDYQVVEEVRLQPSPGHTPGHCSIVISSKGEQAMITGDMIHHPLQACEPEVCSYACVSEEMASTTRRTILKQAAESGMILLGTHFAGPTSVKVEPDGEAWRMVGV